MGKSLRLMALLSLAIGANGCILVADFDPTGGPVSLTGQWSVDIGDGQLAPDAVSCTAAGITELELRVYDDDFLNYYSDSRLRFPCEAGFFASGPMLMHGQYRTRWLAYDANGFEVARSELMPLDASLTTTAIVAPATFIVTQPVPLARGNLDLTLEWDNDPTTLFSPGTCGSAKVDVLQYIVRDEFGAIISEGQAPCTESLIFEDLNFGSYSVEILGAIDGSWLWSSACSPLPLSSVEGAYICGIERNDI